MSAQFAKFRGDKQVAYLRPAEFDKWYSARLPSEQRRPYLERAARNQPPFVEGVFLRNPQTVSGRLLAPGSIVIRRPKPFRSDLERISYGHAIAHEVAHANGANEFEARLAGREYLRRFGLNGPTNEQIMAAIVGASYSLREFRRSLGSYLGRQPGWCKTLWYRRGIQKKNKREPQYRLEREMEDSVW